MSLLPLLLNLPPQIANRDKFLEIHSEDCDPSSIICGIFPSINTILSVNFFNHYKLILHLSITSNNL